MLTRRITGFLSEPNFVVATRKVIASTVILQFCLIFAIDQTASRPPSTGRFTPLTNAASLLARYTAAMATSLGSVIRLKGTDNANLALSSGVSGTPLNNSNNPVADRKGHIELTRIPSGPYSAARP